MPRRKPKPERVVQEKIKESLDSILNDEDLDFDAVKAEELPRLKTTDLMDFSTAQQTTGSDAKSLLDSIVKFYLDENFIDKVDYVEYKKKIDSMNLASMMLQLKTAQHAITKLLEEIDLGNANPRMFEVLAQLQSQIMQMPKDYQNYVDKMEEGYKKIQLQIEKKSDVGSFTLEPSNDTEDSFSANPNGVGGNGIKVRGTKGLMEGLRDILGSEIEDVRVVEENDNAVVNAKRKAEIDASRNVSLSDEDFLEVDDDLFN
jgi:hypothetical protein